MIKKKHIIAGLIGLVTITGAVAYLQYQKLMDYVLSFKSIKVNSIGIKLFDFNLFLNFQNKSNIKFTIVRQKYDVYINGIYLTTLKNEVSNVIEPKSTSVIGLNVRFDPREALQKLKMSAASLAAGPDKVLVKIDTQMTVKYGLLSASIPYVYEDTLKNMMA